MTKALRGMHSPLLLLFIFLSFRGTPTLCQQFPSSSPSPFLASATTPLLPPICTSPSESQPNPIANQYPGVQTGTGTANGTVAIIPIDYDLARSLVPAEYPILTHVYRKLFPSLPKNKYPMFVEAIRDHDIREDVTFVIPDFSRASLIFPFVDRLNNGYSSFRYGGPILISVNEVVQGNSSSLQPTYQGTFDPACEAYAFSSGKEGISGEIFQNSWLGNGQADGQLASFETRFKPSAITPYTIEAIFNITNQPLFGNGTIALCDNFVQQFNTSLTTGRFKPISIVGDVMVRPPFFPSASKWNGVFGFKFDTAWVDTPHVPCGSLAG